MDDIRILIIDDDAETTALLQVAFADEGAATESVRDAFTAMDRLREQNYSAVVLDPAIRHRLNGYAVLSFIELEQPETLEHLFLFTGMSEQTIRRTAPSVLPRFFRKPCDAASVAAAVIAACGQRRASSERRSEGSVLLVEDDLMTANAARSVLNNLGYSVHWAPNGLAAMETLRKQDFDVVMLDLVMPHMDGFAVLEHFQAENPALLRRVIVTTGIPDRYVQQVDRSAICGILPKPMDIAMLTQLLSDCHWERPFIADPGGESPFH
jgi:DNA-binding NtrC family response regulator